MIYSGVTFCIVVRSRQFVHEIILMVVGYQKWHGATPIFNRIAIISRISLVFINQWSLSSVVDPIRNIIDPIA